MSTYEVFECGGMQSKVVVGRCLLVYRLDA